MKSFKEYCMQEEINEGVITDFIDNIVSTVKNVWKDYKHNKYLGDWTEESMQQFIDDVSNSKEKLAGAKKGVLTKLENNLSSAFKSEDPKRIANVIEEIKIKLKKYSI